MSAIRHSRAQCRAAAVAVSQIAIDLVASVVTLLVVRKTEPTSKFAVFYSMLVAYSCVSLVFGIVLLIGVNKKKRLLLDIWIFHVVVLEGSLIAMILFSPWSVGIMTMMIIISICVYYLWTKNIWDFIIELGPEESWFGLLM